MTFRFAVKSHKCPICGSHVVRPSHKSPLPSKPVVECYSSSLTGAAIAILGFSSSGSIQRGTARNRIAGSMHE